MEAAELTELRRRGFELDRPLGSIAFSAIPVRSREEAYDVMRRSPERPPVEASFEGAAASAKGASATRQSTVLGDPQAYVRLVEATFNRFRFASTTTHSGLFVFGVPWFRGWRVEVDGKSDHLQRVGAVYPAVELPPGDHEVELRFESPASVAGMVGFLGCATGVAVHAFWSLFAGRRRLLCLVVLAPAVAVGALWYRSLYGGPSAGTRYVWDSRSAQAASCKGGG
jgi:hypothetical protein